jgi:hypothetical protein
VCLEKCPAKYHAVECIPGRLVKEVTSG